jgi:hypothetical protein
MVRRISCDHCATTFPTKPSLITHMQKSHGAAWGLLNDARPNKKPSSRRSRGSSRHPSPHAFRISSRRSHREDFESEAPSLWSRRSEHEAWAREREAEAAEEDAFFARIERRNSKANMRRSGDRLGGRTIYYKLAEEEMPELMHCEWLRYQRRLGIKAAFVRCRNVEYVRRDSQTDSRCSGSKF